MSKINRLALLFLFILATVHLLLSILFHAFLGWRMARFYLG